MAKPKTETQALERVAPGGALALPDFVDRADNRGAEGIGAGDIRLPRLMLAQSLSPEVVKGDPKRIEGLEVGQMFSNMLQTNFGDGPLEVVVVRREKPRAMEFWPRDSKEGQGIKDRDVPYFGPRDPRNDPRCEFGPNGKKPAATVFHEFVAFVRETREPLVLSFKSTSTPAALTLNTLMKLRGGPAWSTSFRLRSVQQRNEHGPFYVFRVEPGSPVNRDEYDYASVLYDSLKGREVAVDDVAVDPESEEKVPF